MILLNWLPELFLLTLLFYSLLLINFRLTSYRSILLGVVSLSIIELLFLLFRQDLAFFTPPLKILFSDSLSYFGRILSFLSLIVFSLGFHFHRNLNYGVKQRATLFLVFSSIFISALFHANNLVLMLGASLGIYFCSITLIQLESGQSQNWIKLLRGRSLPLSGWIVMFGLIFLLGSSFFGSIYLTDWISELSKGSLQEVQLFVFGALILLVGFLPLSGIAHPGNAPLGQSVLYFGTFLMMAAFWFRLGVPFFAVSNLLNKAHAQVLISLLIGGFALRNAYYSIRTRSHNRWFSYALPAIACLAFFLVVLSGEHVLPAFYCISIALLFTFGLAAQAFLDASYSHKVPVILSIVTLLGAAPLVLGEQFYRVAHDEVRMGNWASGILMFFSWLILAIAGTQMIGKVLLQRVPRDKRRQLFSGELFFIIIYFVCVISLTAFRPQWVSLLNDRPLLNLW